MNDILKSVWVVGDCVPDRKYVIDAELTNLSSFHDLRVCNLEGSFVFEGRPALKAGSTLLLDYSSFKHIAGHFDLMTLANNHAMDFGEQGLKDTQHICTLHSIATIGAGNNIREAFRPFDRGNIRIIAVAEHEFGAAGLNSCGIAITEHEDIIFDLIQEAKSEGRYVVLIAHGGSEIISVPPPYLVRRFRMLARYGADVIIGMHPHVVQGYELFQGTHIYYSLGNFAFESGQFSGYQNADWSLGISIDPATREVKHYPLVCKDGHINVSDNPFFLYELERLSSILEDLDNLDALYRAVAKRLLPAWYGRFFPKDVMNGLLDLHYVRSDAHRSMICSGLSEILGFDEAIEEESSHAIMLAGKDRVWLFDKHNSPLSDLNAYQDKMQMLPEEVVWLRSLLDGQKYLEIGSGFSTLYFSQYAQHIVSAESRVAWYANIRSLLGYHEVKNVDLRLCMPNDCAYDELGQECWLRRVSSEGHISDYGRSEEFKNYLDELRRVIGEKHFDLVLVDGQVRYEVVLLLKEMQFSGCMLLHDVTEDRKYLNDPILNIPGIKVLKQVGSLLQFAFSPSIDLIAPPLKQATPPKVLHRTDWLASNTYFYNNKTGAHGSNINSVIDFENLEIDQEGFNNYLDFGYSVFGRTPVRHLHFMPPHSELAQATDGSFHLRTLEDPALSWLGKETHLDDVMHRLCSLVRDTEKQSSGPLVIPTSGGFDSRIINLIVSDKKRIHSYSYGTSKKQYDSGEAVKASALSKLLGTKWNWIPIKHLNDFLDDWYDIFGVSVHAHGMYQMEFYEHLGALYPAGTTLYSGIIGDIWAGLCLPEIKSIDDLSQLGYSHGMQLSLSHSRVTCDYEGRSRYWHDKKELLKEPSFRVVEMVRRKIILLHYLTTIPSLYGFNVTAPFLDMELALSMLMLPESYRKDRIWQRALFAECNVDLESMNLCYTAGNYMELETLSGSTLPPLNTECLSLLIDSKLLSDINRYLSNLDYRGEITDKQLIRSYYDYALLFPLSKLLGSITVRRDQRD